MKPTQVPRISTFYANNTRLFDSYRHIWACNLKRERGHHGAWKED